MCVFTYATIANICIVCGHITAIAEKQNKTKPRGKKFLNFGQFYSVHTLQDKRYSPVHCNIEFLFKKKKMLFSHIDGKSRISKLNEWDGHNYSWVIRIFCLFESRRRFHLSFHCIFVFCFENSAKRLLFSQVVSDFFLLCIHGRTQKCPHEIVGFSRWFAACSLSDAHENTPCIVEHAGQSKQLN